MARILLGFMGSGKTTVAPLLQGSYLDMDLLIQEKIGMSIRDFFATKGEAAFREIESETLADLMALDDETIISTGGGIVTLERNRNLLRTNKAHNIFLKASFDVIYQRISNDKVSERPLFLTSSKEAFKRLFDERMMLYQDLAATVIDVDDKTPEQVAEAIECCK